MQRCYDFDEQIQTHDVAINQQITAAAATEIKQLEAALQEAQNEKSAQQEKACAQGAKGGAAGHDEIS